MGNTGVMAALSKPSLMRIGVIAEENNDVEVLYELTSKLVAKNSFSFSRFVGHGCGKVRRKCEAWANNLLTRGCSVLVVIHDLDKRNELELRTTLETQVRASGFPQSVVLIPVQEIEAWLLSDPKAIQQVFRMRKVPRVPSRPERIPDPKEFLSRLVSANSQSHYLNTVHNRKIASALTIDALDCCPSFWRYPKFLADITKKQRKDINRSGR